MPEKHLMIWAEFAPNDSENLQIEYFATYSVKPTNIKKIPISFGSVHKQSHIGQRCLL